MTKERKFQRRMNRLIALARYNPNSFRAMMRDNNRCVDCGLRVFDKIQIHHINQNRECNELSNLVTLCRKCHRRRHLFLHHKTQREAIPRNREIVQLRNDGMTFQEIADKMALSRQRIHQIYKSLN